MSDHGSLFLWIRPLSYNMSYCQMNLNAHSRGLLAHLRGRICLKLRLSPSFLLLNRIWWFNVIWISESLRKLQDRRRPIKSAMAECVVQRHDMQGSYSIVEKSCLWERAFLAKQYRISTHAKVWARLSPTWHYLIRAMEAAAPEQKTWGGAVFSGTCVYIVLVWG